MFRCPKTHRCNRIEMIQSDCDTLHFYHNHGCSNCIHSNLNSNSYQTYSIKMFKSKSNLLLYSLYFVVWNEFAEPISQSLHSGNKAFFEMSQQWRAVGNSVSHVTGPRLESSTYRSRDECVTARPTGRSYKKIV